MNTFTICRRELNSYFRSPVAYGVMFFFALIAGYFLWVAVRAFVSYSLQMTLTGQSVPLSVDDLVVRGLLSNLAVIGLFMIPMIAMRLFAEEKRTGTIELLITSPLRNLEIILGKWLAAVGLYAAMLALSLANVAILYLYGKPSWKPLLIGYLGLLLEGAGMLAIVTFVSSLTKNQILAVCGGFGVLLLLWVINWGSSAGSGDSGFLGLVSRVCGYLSITDRFENFSRGVLDIRDPLYFISLVVVGLFLTGRSLESMRWRA